MPEFDYSVLVGKIIEKFGSQKKFAKALGISEKTLSLKLNNKVYFSQDEMINSINALGEKTDLIKVYFFTAKVQKLEPIAS